MCEVLRRKILGTRNIGHILFICYFTAGIGGYEPSTSECFGCGTPVIGSNLQDRLEVWSPRQTDRSRWGRLCFHLASSLFESTNKSTASEGEAAKKGVCFHGDRTGRCWRNCLKFNIISSMLTFTGGGCTLLYM